MKSVNYKIGALKRKYQLGKGDIEPGTFINKINVQKATEKLPEKKEVKVAILGLV